MPIRQDQPNSMHGRFVETCEQLFACLVSQGREKSILWFGITGSWRKTNKEIEDHVRDSVRKVMEYGGGIISGGALGVDFFATDEAMKLDDNADRIRIILPVSLDLFEVHFRKRAEADVISRDQARMLIAQLEELQTRNPLALRELEGNAELNDATYFERNTAVVNASDAVLAFHVNESAGVADTINKAIEQHKPVFLRKYRIA